MMKKTILVDDARRELSEHGTETFPLTVHHDDLWMFEGKNVPIHWHQEIEISLPREGKAIYQFYQNSYEISPGDGLLLNRNVPHSCHSPNNERAKYTTILVRPDFLYGDFGSDVERNCFRPFLQNSAVPCLCIPGTEAWGKEVLEKLEKVDTLFYEKPYCYELKIKGLLCEAFFLILVHQQKYQTPFVPAVRMPERKRLFATKNMLHLFDCLQHFKIRSSHLDIGNHRSAVRFFHRDFENRSLLDLRGCEIAHEFYELRVVLGETVSQIF